MNGPLALKFNYNGGQFYKEIFIFFKKWKSKKKYDFFFKKFEKPLIKVAVAKIGQRNELSYLTTQG